MDVAVMVAPHAIKNIPFKKYTEEWDYATHEETCQ